MSLFTLPISRDDVIRFETNKISFWVWDNPEKISPLDFADVCMIINESKRAIMKYDSETSEGWRFVGSWFNVPSFELIILK